MQKINGKQTLINSNINPAQVDAYIKANPELKQLAEDLASFMREEAVPRYRSTFEDLTGLPLEETEFYIPTLREGDQDVSIMQELITPDGQYTGRSVMSDYMKPKTDNSKPLKIRGITNVVTDYITQMERTMAFLPAADEFSNVFSKNTTGMFKKLLGKEGNSDVNNIMTVFDEAILGGSRLGREEQVAVDALNRYFIVKTLGLNPKLIGGQAVSGLHFYPLATTNPEYGVTTEDIVKASIDMFNPRKELSNAQQTDNVFFLQKFVTDPQFKDRWNRIGIDPALEKYQDKNPGRVKQTLDQLTGLATIGIRVGDMAGVFGGLPVAKAMYNNYRADGMAPNRAYDKAMKNYYKLVTKYQQTNNRLYTPEYAYSNFGKIMTPYTSALNANANELSVTLQKFRDKSLSSKDEYNNMMRLAYLIAPATGMFNLIQSDFGEEGKEIENRMESAPELTNEERLQKQRLYGLGMNTFQSVIGGFGPLGSVVNYGINAGRNRPDQFSRPFFLSEVENLAKIGGILLEQFGGKDWDDLTEGEKRALSKLAGKFKTMPEQAIDLFKGEIDFGDFMRGRKSTYGRDRKLERYEGDIFHNILFGVETPPERKKAPGSPSDFVGGSGFTSPSKFKK